MFKINGTGLKFLKFIISSLVINKLVKNFAKLLQK